MEFIEIYFETINNLITIRNTKYNKIYNIDNECILIDNKIKNHIILLEKYLRMNNIYDVYINKNIIYYKKLYNDITK
jgi:hypothetical protein